MFAAPQEPQGPSPITLASKQEVIQFIRTRAPKEPTWPELLLTVCVSQPTAVGHVVGALHDAVEELKTTSKPALFFPHQNPEVITKQESQAAVTAAIFEAQRVLRVDWNANRETLQAALDKANATLAAVRNELQKAQSLLAGDGATNVFYKNEKDAAVQAAKDHAEREMDAVRSTVQLLSKQVGLSVGEQARPPRAEPVPVPEPAAPKPSPLFFDCSKEEFKSRLQTWAKYFEEHPKNVTGLDLASILRVPGMMQAFKNTQCAGKCYNCGNPRTTFNLPVSEGSKRCLPQHMGKDGEADGVPIGECTEASEAHCKVCNKASLRETNHVATTCPMRQAAMLKLLQGKHTVGFIVSHHADAKTQKEAERKRAGAKKAQSNRSEQDTNYTKRDSASHSSPVKQTSSRKSSGSRKGPRKDDHDELAATLRRERRDRSGRDRGAGRESHRERREERRDRGDCEDRDDRRSQRDGESSGKSRKPKKRPRDRSSSDQDSE